MCLNKNDIGILIEAPLNPFRCNKDSNDLTGEKEIPNNIVSQNSPTAKMLSIFLQKCNFLLFARYSFELSHCSLLVVKSLVTHFKIRYSLLKLLVAKKSLVTRCEIRLLLVTKNHSLLAAKVSRCQ